MTSNNNKHIRIASRASSLALWQTQKVAKSLEKLALQWIS